MCITASLEKCVSVVPPSRWLLSLSSLGKRGRGLTFKSTSRELTFRNTDELG
jgi:hypothetical protein